VRGLHALTVLMASGSPGLAVRSSAEENTCCISAETDMLCTRKKTHMRSINVERDSERSALVAERKEEGACGHNTESNLFSTRQEMQ
jgi:hypothetical protein